MPVFEETFGKPVKEMDEGEWRMAVYSLIHGLRLDNEIAHKSINMRLDETNGKVRKIPELSECVSHHKLYFKIWAGIGVPVVIAVLIAFFKFVLNL